MAKQGAFQGYIQVNGVDLSNHCTEFDAVQGRENLPAHAMGDDDNYGMPGLKTGDISATFLQDFAGGSVHATLRPLYENGTIVPVVWRATNAAASATNPEYSGQFFCQNYRAIGGAHGQQSLAEVTFARAGDVDAVA